MFWLCIESLFLLRFVMVELPRRVTALLACAALGIVLWRYRRYESRRAITGAEVAATILSKNGLRTHVCVVHGWLSDCYLPREDTVALSEQVFAGTNIGALSIAAHEAGHAIQANRLLSPWWPMRFWSPIGGLGLGLCFWLWLAGSIVEDQRWALATFGCFGAYLLFLLLQIVCESDASRRAVRELLRHGLIDRAEFRVARRILRSALVTYIAAFAASSVLLAVFLPGIKWP